VFEQAAALLERHCETLDEAALRELTQDLRAAPAAHALAAADVKPRA
jgi:hypothetical protein